VLLPEIRFSISPPVANAALDALYYAAWPHHSACDFQPVLQHSLAYVCAYQGDRLVGFVYVAWDAGVHAFLLEPTVHPDVRRRGLGSELVRRAAAIARERGCQWLHVDYEAHLESFYTACGFKPTLAGLIRLDKDGA
jgi:GNAT superfamily N-acetyltransferase